MMERVLSWTFGLTLAFLLLFEVYQAFFWLNPNPVFGWIAARSGIDLFEPGLRYVTGALEAVAAALLFIPKTREWGARLAAVIVLGAIGFHLSPWLGVQIPEPRQLSEALAGGWTASDIEAMRLPTDHGAMFILALAILGLSVAVIFTERALHRAAAPHAPKPLGAFA